MSANALTTANASGFPWWGTDRGATDVAQAVQQRVTAAAESLRDAEHGRRIRESRLALSEAVKECSVPDWDGYGAAPANLMSASWAEKVVGAFPPGWAFRTSLSTRTAMRFWSGSSRVTGS